MGRYVIKDLGGRREVEKQIQRLQELERKGEVETKRFFVFDLDSAPTALKSTPLVRILQWKRRCLENYLIDIDVIFDLLHSDEIARDPIRSRPELLTILRDLAANQLSDVVAKEVFEETSYGNAGFRAQNYKENRLAIRLTRCFRHLNAVRNQLADLNELDWKRAFVTRCESIYEARKQSWRDDWVEKCDGKRLFVDLHKTVAMKVSLLRLKQKIVAEMQGQKSDLWRSVDSLLKDMLQSNV